MAPQSDNQANFDINLCKKNLLKYCSGTGTVLLQKAKGSPAPGRLDGEPSTFFKRTMPAPKQHFKKFLLAKVISKYDWLSSGGPFEITN